MNFCLQTQLLPHFNKQFFPIFIQIPGRLLQGYFSFTSRFLDIGREQLTIGLYLGRVNAGIYQQS